MAKRKSKSKRPQARHKKQKKSQHDKRKRLQHRNLKRQKTTQAKVPLTGPLHSAVALLQACLDRRIAFRLAIIIAGMFLADDRRTASAWFVTAGVQDDWDRFYDCLISIGRTSEKLATVVLGLVVQKFPGLLERITIGLDDSPTSAMESTSKEPVSITTQRPGRLAASGCMDTIGSHWPGWRGIRSGV